jgi:predicted molibdopterin-dependent oxidoreductase YjgC
MKTETAQMNCTIDGDSYSFQPGETLLEIADRNGITIPTLCHDPRLDPAGACRSCLVEIKGQRRLLPSCATKATEGVEFHTDNERVKKHRKTLFSLYLTDHPAEDDEKGQHRGAPNKLAGAAKKFGAEDWGKLANLRDEIAGDRGFDRNPYIQFDSDLCIVCAKCTRYCDEVEAVSAITLAGRGSETSIATPDSRSLLDTTCEMCGGCVDVCPTGAMGEKKPKTNKMPLERELSKVRTTCNYCGVGCQFDFNVDPNGRDGLGEIVKVTSPSATPNASMALPAGFTGVSSDGNLCVKGRFGYDFIHHEERLSTPLVRGADGDLHPATWDEAFDAAAAGLAKVAEKHGVDALAFVSSSRCTIEENYLMQKISRAVYGTNNIHQCSAT